MSASDDNPRDRLQHHHSHEHDLVLLELSSNCSTFECFICLSSVKGGPAYHCPDCNDFFLHIYCAELPSVIQHPFHPQHQLLILRKDDWARGFCSGCSGEMSLKRCHYRCAECSIALHLGCAAATLPTHKHEDKPEEVETIQHGAHEHPLESFYINKSLCPCYCRGCKEEISGSAYGCRACIFVLHESCALAPPKINNHPLHPKHPLTLLFDFREHVPWAGPSRFVYRCKQCHFILEMRCAFNVERHHISNPQDDHNSEKYWHEIQHFSHPHAMTYCYTKGATGLWCDFCKEKITGDLYVCGDCSFNLHKSCAELPQDMVHPLHPHDHLILQESKYGRCTLCGNNHEFLFVCQQCDFSLHTQCALLYLSAAEEELDINIQHIHEHTMRLRMNTSSRNHLCYVCQEAAKGLVYACKVCNKVEIHRSCAEASLESQHSIHPSHPLVLHPEPPSECSGCSACLDDCSGFTFYCEYCKFQFHPRCAKMKPSLKHERHEHSLTYFSQIDQSVQCNVCYHDCRVDFYRCFLCNYNLHYDCSPLPPSVKDKWHIHTMELRDKYINDTFEDQYCDKCETLRHPERGVYVCEECRCAVHIDCVIPNPRVDLEKKRRMEELKIEKLGEQIAHLEMEINKTMIYLESSKKNLEQLKAEKLQLVTAMDEQRRDKI